MKDSDDCGDHIRLLHLASFGQQHLKVANIISEKKKHT